MFAVTSSADAPFTVFKSSAAVGGPLSARDAVLGGELVLYTYPASHPWGPVLVSSQGKINWASVKDAPSPDDPDALKRRAIAEAGIIAAAVAAILGALYAAWRAYFGASAAGATTGAYSALPTTEGGTSGGQNARDANNENDNMRTPAGPGLFGGELARDGLEALRDVSMRGRTSGVGAPANFMTSNPVYDVMPEWLTSGLAA